MPRRPPPASTETSEAIWLKNKDRPLTFGLAKVVQGHSSLHEITSPETLGHWFTGNNVRERTETFNAFLRKEDVDEIFITNEMKIETNSLAELKLKRAALAHKFKQFVTNKDHMKLTEFYGSKHYHRMLTKTELLKTKSLIKEMYLQNLLTVNKKSQEFYVDKDPAASAFLNGDLTEYLEHLKSLPLSPGSESDQLGL